MKAQRLVRLPIRVYFGEEGLHPQDPITISKTTWESFCGYLENRSILLLYHSASLYRIIPKRALGLRKQNLERFCGARFLFLTITILFAWGRGKSPNPCEGL
jgi:hypothetical protein